MTPTARQRATGQHWLACTAYIADQSPNKTTDLTSYRGTLRDAAWTGVGRDYLGYCPAEADWNQMTTAACTQPHHGEIFGNGNLPASATRATLTASCTKLVEHATYRTAQNVDARLSVSVQANDMNGNTIDGPTIPANATVQCGVLAAGGRLLNGSLIAIGSAPIPWA